MTTKYDRKYIVLILLILYIGLVTTLSLIKISDDLSLPKTEHFDKFVHFCFYLGFSSLLLSTLLVFSRFRVAKNELYAIFSTVSYSIVIELVQSLVGRSFDIDDIIANATGVAVGYAIYRLKIVQKLIMKL